MNQGEAIVTLIEVVREWIPDPSPRLKRALKIMETRAEVLRCRNERRAMHRRCPCGERECINIVCYLCFGSASAEVREMWRIAKTAEDRRVAARGLIRHAISRRAAEV
jgi:hypothetical protein